MNNGVTNYIKVTDSRFIWAKLQIDQLNLQQPLKGVASDFQRFSHRETILENDSEVVKKTLVWLAASARTLDARELTIAVNPDMWHDFKSPQDDEILQAKMLPIKKSMEATPVINVGSERQPDGWLNPYFINALERDRVLLETCLSYLGAPSGPLADGPVFTQPDLNSRLERNPFLSYAVYYWMSHYRPDFSERVVSFLVSRNSNYLAWSQLYETREYPPDPDPPTYEEFETARPPSEFEFQCPETYPSGLYYAALFGMTEVVKLLLKKNEDIDVNRSGGYYRFALHAAACRGHGEVIDTLLKAGANRDLTDMNGRTGLEIAILYRHTAAVSILDPGRMQGDREQANDQHVNPGIEYWSSQVEKNPSNEELLDKLNAAYREKADNEFTIAGWKEVVLKHPYSRGAIDKLREAFIANDNCNTAIAGWWEVYEVNMLRLSILKELRDSFDLKYRHCAKTSLLQFFFYCLMVLIARKLMQWGAERVDWWPLATEEEIIKLLPYTMRHENTKVRHPDKTDLLRMNGRAT